MKETKSRAMTEWVPINEVMPNSLNPRRDDSIKSLEIQSILNKRGWEEPLTVYKDRKNYILLSGHRRLYAAKHLKMVEVPVYVVERPANSQEEIERISSLQRGRVDWTAFEWAESTYNKWVIWGKPPIPGFAKSINMRADTVREYVTVMSYYKRSDIEAKLENKTYSISQLYVLSEWLELFKLEKPALYQSLSPKLVRETMLRKVTEGRASRDELRKKEVVSLASEGELIQFLNTSTYTLNNLLDMYDMNRKVNERTFHGAMISLGKLQSSVNKYEAPTEPDLQEKYLEALRETLKVLNKKVRDLKKAI